MKRAGSASNLQLQRERDEMKLEVERLQELLKDAGATGGDAKAAMKRCCTDVDAFAFKSTRGSSSCACHESVRYK